MIYAEVSDASARDHLESALCEATHLKWYRRLMIIKLSATEGLSVPHLAKLFNLSDDSVRSYIHKYNTSGLEALMPKSPPGRRGKITHFSKSDWERLFEQTPDQYEKLQTESRQWTLDLMCLYFKAYHEISITPSAICMALRRIGYRTGRSKLRVGSPDPEYQAKRKQLMELASLRNGAVNERGDSVDCPGSPTAAVRSPAPPQLSIRRLASFSLTKRMCLGVRKPAASTGSKAVNIRSTPPAKTNGNTLSVPWNTQQETACMRFMPTKHMFR